MLFRRPRSSRSIRLAAALLAGAALAAPAAPAGAFDTGSHTRFSGGDSPMGQTDGPVLTVQVAGGHIFAGGRFRSTRPAAAAAGTGETGIGYLAAFDAVTGEPWTGFAHVLSNDYTNGLATVMSSALSPDRKTLYVGGDFNLVDGKRAEHLAAFDTTTGDFLGQVGAGGVNGSVRALAISPDGRTLYAGGTFTTANWQPRAHLAAFDLTDGSVTPFTARLGNPVSNQTLRAESIAVAADGSKAFVAGPFRTVNGVTSQGFAALDATSGARLPAFRGDYLYSPTSWGTVVRVAGGTVYLGGRSDPLPGTTSSPNRTEGVYAIDAATGTLRWGTRCFGDTFAIQPVGNEIYVGNHAHDCEGSGGLAEAAGERQYVSGSALNASNGTVKPWFPQADGIAGVNDTLLHSRALATDGDQLVMGGGFTAMDGHPQANLARFRPGDDAPSRPWGSAKQSCFLLLCGSVSVTVQPSFDRDDVNLTYRLFRNHDTTSPVATVTRTSLPWPRTAFTLTDPGSGLRSGTPVFYRVEATDPAGHRVMSVDTNTITFR
ncbi:outer membrane protein assembly factor BamB family protein [Marmoricola sp. RAF53]|uniref:outer membrane protein assembly factor BamB family protein n=1 Tax=Marmoricola sp. RAF53 TaxID=3233059 RepID=UPI003F9E46FD